MPDARAKPRGGRVVWADRPFSEGQGLQSVSADAVPWVRLLWANAHLDQNSVRLRARDPERGGEEEDGAHAWVTRGPTPPALACPQTIPVHGNRIEWCSIGTVLGGDGSSYGVPAWPTSGFLRKKACSPSRSTGSRRPDSPSGLILSANTSGPARTRGAHATHIHRGITYPHTQPGPRGWTHGTGHQSAIVCQTPRGRNPMRTDRCRVLELVGCLRTCPRNGGIRDIPSPMVICSFGHRSVGQSFRNSLATGTRGREDAGAGSSAQYLPCSIGRGIRDIQIHKRIAGGAVLLQKHTSRVGHTLWTGFGPPCGQCKRARLSDGGREWPIGRGGLGRGVSVTSAVVTRTVSSFVS